MAKTVIQEVLPAVLAEHRAIRAWQQLHPERPEPERIEIVTLKNKTAVYRLWGVRRDGGPVVAKRCDASSGHVERLVYEQLLPGVSAPTLRCFGWVPEPAGAFGWLFLEDAGAHAYSSASGENRVLAGHWLAALHRTDLSPPLRAALPDRSPAHYLQRIRFCRAALRRRVDNPALSAQESESLRTLVAWLDLMEARWPELQRFFQTWPQALVHGDFVVKNLRLRSAGAGAPELLVFDWEMAGWGVPAVDLAQVGSGTANPDLETYAASVNGLLPRAPAGGLERLAAFGSLLRLVDQISWEALTMKGQSYRFLLKPLSTLQLYEPQLAAALRALKWLP
jgi:hypothetical protein